MIPADRPAALTRAYAEDPVKQRQWAAFVEQVALNPGSLTEVVDSLADFLMPHAGRARGGF